MYQITVKAYDGSIPVQTGSWSPEAGESVRDMEQIPVRVTCTWDRASRTDRFRIRAEALEDLTFPVSVSLERVEEKWTRNEYVFMPAAVYNGNRMESRKIPYPPYCGEKTETGWREVITDIPHLSKDGENRDIQFLSGIMARRHSDIIHRRTEQVSFCWQNMRKTEDTRDLQCAKKGRRQSLAFPRRG